MCKEFAVDCNGVLALSSHLSAAVSRGKPALELVTFAARHGHFAVNFAIGDRDTGGHHGAAVGIEGDGVGVDLPVCNIAAVARASPLDGDSHALTADARARPTDEGIAGLFRILQGDVRGLNIVSRGVAGNHAAVQIIADVIGDQFAVCLIFHSVCRHGKLVLLLALRVGARPASPFIACLQRCIDRNHLAVLILTAAADGFDTLTRLDCQNVAVAGVVILHNGTAVGCDGHFLYCRRGESCIDLDRGINFSVGRACQCIHIFRNIRIRTIQILQIMLDRIGGIGAGFPLCGEGHITILPLGDTCYVFVVLSSHYPATICLCYHPAVKDVTSFGRYGQEQIRIHAEDSLFGIDLTSVRIERRGVGDHIPCCCVRAVTDAACGNRHRRSSFRESHTCPACKIITGASGVIQGDGIGFHCVGCGIFRSNCTDVEGIGDFVNDRCVDKGDRLCIRAIPCHLPRVGGGVTVDCGRGHSVGAAVGIGHGGCSQFLSAIGYTFHIVGIRIGNRFELCSDRHIARHIGHSAIYSMIPTVECRRIALRGGHGGGCSVIGRTATVENGISFQLSAVHIHPCNGVRPLCGGKCCGISCVSGNCAYYRCPLIECVVPFCCRCLGRSVTVICGSFAILNTAIGFQNSSVMILPRNSIRPLCFLKCCGILRIASNCSYCRCPTRKGIGIFRCGGLGRVCMAGCRTICHRCGVDGASILVLPCDCIVPQ